MAAPTPNLQFTFGELAKRLGGQSTLVRIAEVLNGHTPMLQDVIWKACNRIDHEYVVRRNSLPTGTWRKANRGSSKSASSTQADNEYISKLEALSDVDEILLELLEGNEKKDARRSEDIAFSKGLGRQIAKALIQGTNVNQTTSAPEEILGLAQRLTSTSQTTVMSNGGSTSNSMTSIYVVDWNFDAAYCIFPRGAKRGVLGLSTVDKGLVDTTDSDSNIYHVWRTQFGWWIGFAVRNQNSIGRLCNIDITKTSGKYPFAENNLIELLNYGDFNAATTRIYMNKRVYTDAQIKLKDKTNVNFTPEKGLSGEPLMRFQGCLIRMCDDSVIVNNEDTVS